MATSSENPYDATVTEWVRRTGISRTRTYEALADDFLSSRNIGALILLDFAAGLAWIGAQPPAFICKRFEGLAKRQADRWKKPVDFRRQKNTISV